MKDREAILKNSLGSGQGVQRLNGVRAGGLCRKRHVLKDVTHGELESLTNEGKCGCVSGGSFEDDSDFEHEKLIFTSPP